MADLIVAPSGGQDSGFAMAILLIVLVLVGGGIFWYNSGYWPAAASNTEIYVTNPPAQAPAPDRTTNVFIEKDKPDTTIIVPPKSDEDES